MKNKITLSFIAIAAITTFAFTTKAPTVYAIDTKTTTVAWIGRKVTGEHSGTLKISKGDLLVDGKNIVGGTLEFDMTSMGCTDLTNKDDCSKLIGHLQKDVFFDVAKFPTAKFEITKVVSKSEDDYIVTGKLTIKDITNEINFPAVIKMNDKAIITVAKIIVNRVKFGITYGSATLSDTISDKAISDDFELNVNIIATVISK